MAFVLKSLVDKSSQSEIIQEAKQQFSRVPDGVLNLPQNIIDATLLAIARAEENGLRFFCDLAGDIYDSTTDSEHPMVSTERGARLFLFHQKNGQYTAGQFFDESDYSKYSKTLDQVCAFYRRNKHEDPQPKDGYRGASITGGYCQSRENHNYDKGEGPSSVITK